MRRNHGLCERTAATLLVAAASVISGCLQSGGSDAGEPGTPDPSQASSPSPGGAAIDTARIVREVEDAVRAFRAADTARDAEGVIDLLWPDFEMLADGARQGYADVVPGTREFMAGLEVFHTEWTDLRITPLGPDAAVASFQFRDSIVAATGDLTMARGPTTLIWERRGVEWRVRFADADHYPIER